MENYVEDILNQLIAEANEIKANASDDFEKGKLFGYYQTISRSRRTMFDEDYKNRAVTRKPRSR